MRRRQLCWTNMLPKSDLVVLDMHQPQHFLSHLWPLYQLLENDHKQPFCLQCHEHLRRHDTINDTVADHGIKLDNRGYSMLP
jgi:hypothetical protein